MRGRLVGFEKDIGICLSPVPRIGSTGKTHAYFPALAACTSTLEYLTALERGNTRGVGSTQIVRFASRYMRQPDFDADTVRVLFEALRHPVAHRGIASGIWVDRNNGAGNGRRFVWKIAAGAKRPACRVVAEDGVVKRDSPWPCSYTHRMHINLMALGVEVRDAAKLYLKRLLVDARLQRNFEACMQQLYPQ